MLGCFDIEKKKGKLAISIRNVPVRSDVDMLVDVLTKLSKGHDQKIFAMLEELDDVTKQVLESGDYSFDFYSFFKQIKDEESGLITGENIVAVTDLIDVKTNTMRLRVTEAEELTSYLHFSRLSAGEKRRQMSEIIETIKENPGQLYNPERARAATGINIPASTNGLAPDYSSLRDTISNGKNIVFTGTTGKKGIVEIIYSSSRNVDFSLAYQKLQLTPQQIKEIEKDYVWHHLDDFNPETGKGTMQLVLKDLHNTSVFGNAFSHTGGSSLWTKFFLIEYR